MNFGLDSTTVKKILSVFKKFPEIKKVKIYGSRAKGNYKPGSDIDLAIIDSDINFESINKLRSQLDDLNTPYTFDICDYKLLTTKEFIDHIDRIGIIFYSVV